MKEPGSPWPGSLFGQAWYGFFAPLRAARFLGGENRDLRKFCVLPALLNALLLVVLVVLAILYGDDLLNWVWHEPQGWLRALYFLARILAVGVLLVVAYGLFLLTGALLAGPFNDYLSEQTEKRLRQIGAEAPFSWRLFLQDLLFATWDGLRELSLYALLLLGLLLLNVLPVVGSALHFILGGGVTLFFLALECVSPALSRRRYSFPQRWGIIWRHRWLMFGLAGAVTLLMLIPLVNFLVLPLAVVAGTMLFVDLWQAGQLPPAPRPWPAPPAAGSEGET